MKKIKTNLKFILSLTLIAVFFAVIYKLYIPRINAFGCFDDCFNYLGGYFLTQGKQIYTDFFYNHQPGMALLSAFVQLVFHPDNIPELILTHRQFMILSSFILSILLFIRFGYKVLLVTIIYELTKFYVFGDRFLAENIVGYIIIYQLGVVLESVKGVLRKIDLFLMPLAGFSVFLLREPYILATAFLQLFYFIKIFKFNKNNLKYPIGIYATLTILSLLSVNINDYYLNLITSNSIILKSETSSHPLIIKIIYIIFYPFFLIFSQAPWTYFRIFLALISGLFLFVLIFYLKNLRSYLIPLIVVIILILVNLRPSAPNVTFFEAFNMSVWLITFLFCLSFMIFEIRKINNRAGNFFIAISVLVLLLFVSDKRYFANDMIDQNEEFYTNFSYVMETGTIIRNLSKPGDTIFTDGYDDIIIWESKLNSSYKYSWYTSYMPRIDVFENERSRMFLKSPPDFYYGNCLDGLKEKKDEASRILTSDYVQLNPKKDTRCILVNKTKLNDITEDQKGSLNGTKYKLP